MAEYYFDTEVGCDEEERELFIRGESEIRPERYKIITIQFQRLDESGRPAEPLRILKEWEMGEEGVIRELSKLINPKKAWQFIPVGQNLMFDLGMLKARAAKHGIVYDEWFLFNQLPRIDLKHICLGMNGFKFAGSGLDKFCNKPRDGEKVPVWYLNKEYEKILEYVSKEAEEFVSLYGRLKHALPKFRMENGFYSL